MVVQSEKVADNQIIIFKAFSKKRICRKKIPTIFSNFITFAKKKSKIKTEWLK
jgi:hypothetical protein